ncbi:MAG: haloacid dehalogenase type II [Candidatus Rokubacteria bacterium]|nr:haloacid dehalogenase type II [Candidatus Rokubacteria bacterium]
MTPDARSRPVAVAFDVVGTLFALDPLAARMRDTGLGADAVGEWFSRFLRDAMALDAAGLYVPFRQVGAATLEVMIAERHVTSGPAMVDQILGALAELPPHPDVRPAFECLKGAGIRIAALTNGGAEATKKLLARAQLDAFVERIISIDEVRHWKPRREVYLHAAQSLGVAPEALALVAAHAWDICGATRAGLVTAWVARKETVFHAAMATPTLKAADLVEAVTALAGLDA